MKLFRKIIDLIRDPGLNDLTIILDKKDVDNISTDEVIMGSVKKYRKQYILVLALIMLFELIMILRGIIFFDFTQIRRILYMVSYVLLLAFSAVGFISMIISNKKNIISKVHVRLVYAYCIFLTLWAFGISLLDIYNGHTPIVFMTVAMGTGALAFIKPSLYISIVSPLSAFMLWFASKFGEGAVARAGYPINFIVFIIFTFFIVSRQFNQNKLDYIVMKKLNQLSCHDQLTGIKNRYALVQTLDNMADVFYFGIFDFDNFKMINDMFGHDFGDKALCDVASLLEEKFNGLAFRYGGDEFVIVSTERKDEIIKRCQQVNSELKEKYPNVDVQLSGGFYLPRSKDETYLDYLKFADEALYKSKDQGKGKFVFYGEE